MSNSKAVRTTEEFRGFLLECAKKVESGAMAAQDGRNIVGMANQVNLSIQAELKHMTLALEMGQKSESFGGLQIATVK